MWHNTNNTGRWSDRFVKHDTPDKTACKTCHRDLAPTISFQIQKRVRWPSAWNVNLLQRSPHVPSPRSVLCAHTPLTPPPLVWRRGGWSDTWCSFVATAVRSCAARSTVCLLWLERPPEESLWGFRLKSQSCRCLPEERIKQVWRANPGMAQRMWGSARRLKGMNR